MDKSYIIATVSAIIMGVMGWFLNQTMQRIQATEDDSALLRHELDLMSVAVTQSQGELRDLWGKYNKAQDDQLQFMQLYYINRIEIEKRICKPN